MLPIGQIIMTDIERYININQDHKVFHVRMLKLMHTDLLITYSAKERNRIALSTYTTFSLDPPRRALLASDFFRSISLLSLDLVLLEISSLLSTSAASLSSFWSSSSFSLSSNASKPPGKYICYYQYLSHKNTAIFHYRFRD